MLILLFIISTKWISFLNVSEVYDMFSLGNSLLIGTTGGALIFNKKDTSFTHITNIDGLLSNKVSQVKIDQYGNIWFLCVDGGITLMSQDRSRIRKFTCMDNLPSYNFSSIFIDGDTVWVGTNDEWEVWLYNMKGNPFEEGKVTLLDIEPTNEINKIEIIGDSIWFGTNRGISVVQKGDTSFTVYNVNDGLPNDTVFAIIHWGTHYWAGTKSGVARFTSTEWETISSDFHVYDFCSNDTSLWVATSEGMFKWDGAGWINILSLDSRTVLFDSLLWIGTFGDGIVRYDGTLHQYIPPGPTSNYFASLTIDLDGNLWCVHKPVHCLEVSKLYYNGTKWKWEIYNKNNEWGTAGGGPCKVVIDRKNNKWIGMWDWTNTLGVIKILPNDSIIKFKIEGTGNPNCILSCCLDDADNLWIGCLDKCIRRIRNDMIDTVISNDYTRCVQALFVDTDENLWVGERDSGLWIFLKGGGVSRISGIPIEPIKFIKSFGNEIWIGTDSGVYQVVDREVTISYTRTDMRGIAKDVVKDSDGGTWFAVKDIGIKRLKPNGTWGEQYSIENGLVDKEILQLEFDEKLGVLWIGTVRGLSRYTIESGISEKQLVPKVFALSECSPNPFTHSTTIKYHLPAKTKVSLKIYDVTGRMVKTFVNKEREAGCYNVELDAEGLGSGIYFIKLVAGDYKSIKKLILMR